MQFWSFHNDTVKRNQASKHKKLTIHPTFKATVAEMLVFPLARLRQADISVTSVSLPYILPSILLCLIMKSAALKVGQEGDLCIQSQLEPWSLIKCFAILWYVQPPSVKSRRAGDKFPFLFCININYTANPKPNWTVWWRCSNSDCETLWGIVWTPPSVSRLVYCLPTPVWPQGDPAETALYVPQCQQPLKCRGRCIAAVQFHPAFVPDYSTACCEREAAFLMGDRRPHLSPSFLFPVSALCLFLNSPKSLFFPTFSPTPGPSHDPKWCRSSYAAEHK